MKNHLKKLISLMVIIATIFALAVTAFAFTGAKAVNYDQVYYESITADAKDDYFKFSLGSYSKVVIGITTTIRPYTLTIYDANQKEVWSKKVTKKLFENVTYESAFYNTNLDAGDYFLKVSSTATGEYNLKLTYTLATKVVGETDSDKNNSIVEAKSIPLATTVTGKLLKEGEQDFFKFVLPSAGSLNYKMISKMRYYSAAILDANGNQIWNTDKNEWDSSKKIREDNHKLELSAGTYYLKVNGYRSKLQRIVATGNYEFKLTFASAGANEVEPNDTYVEAKKVALNKTYKGHLSITDKKDTFEINIANGELAIGFISNMDSYSIYVLDEMGATKWSSKNNTKAADAASRSDLHKVKLGAGKYFIRVEGGAGKYSFKLDQQISLSKVTKLKYSKSVTYITLKWSKVPNAHGYEVYKYDEAKKEYVKIGATSKKSLKIKKLSGGTDYKFKVKAYRKINSLLLYGDESDILTASTLPKKVSLKSASASGSKQATVKWASVNGATGYRIYYSVDRDFETVKKVTVKDGKAASAVIKDLKKGKKYYFRVRAYKKVDGKNFWGKYSNTKSVKVK